MVLVQRNRRTALAREPRWQWCSSPGRASLLQWDGTGLGGPRQPPALVTVPCSAETTAGSACLVPGQEGELEEDWLHRLAQPFGQK